MIVPNLPLLLLNSSAVSNLTTRPKWFNGEANAFCFTQHALPKEPLLPPTYQDCFEAIRLITHGDKKEAPIYFSRDASQGFGLPHTWALGNCEIEIDVDPTDEGDTIKMIDIAKAAFSIAVLCVEQFPYLGGRDRVGPKEVIVIFMYGREVSLKHSLPQIGRRSLVGVERPEEAL